MQWLTLGQTTYRYTLYYSLDPQQLVSTERRLGWVVPIDEPTSFLVLGCNLLA